MDFPEKTKNSETTSNENIFWYSQLKPEKTLCSLILPLALHRCQTENAIPGVKVKATFGFSKRVAFTSLRFHGHVWIGQTIWRWVKLLCDFIIALLPCLMFLAQIDVSRPIKDGLFHSRLESGHAEFDQMGQRNPVKPCLNCLSLAS
jgi:hypothetical protein